MLVGDPSLNLSSGFGFYYFDTKSSLLSFFSQRKLAYVTTHTSTLESALRLFQEPLSRELLPQYFNQE